MGPVSVVVHVGLPKTGTTYLQRVLAEHRERLRGAGVLYPRLRPGAHFEGAVEVRGSAAKFGLDPTAIAGTWERLCAEARSWHEQGGTAVLGHEVLGGASPPEVARALAPLAGCEVHVVATARDLGRQATAHWQEEVKLGATWTFADLERTQLRADTGRDQGPDAGGRRPHFWHAQDWVDALTRWGAGLPPEQVHLVVCPAPGAPPGELWRRFAAAVGPGASALQPDDLEPGALPPANPSLPPAEVALLREVHRALAARQARGEEGLDRATVLRLVKRGWAERELASGTGGAGALTPAALGPLLAEVTEAWVAETRAAGWRVHGSPADLRDLTPVVGEPEDPHPDQPPPPGSDPEALAEAFLVRAREQAGQQAGQQPAPRRGLRARLRRGSGPA